MKSLVWLVEKALGKAPTHMYDYGMQTPQKKALRQWAYEKQLPEAIYPVHCWSAGYGGPQSPLTWFRCAGCGASRLGSPHEAPSDQCWTCLLNQQEFAGWEVADLLDARQETRKASEGMPAESLRRVLEGPGA